MFDFNIAAKLKEEQDKVNVDLAASGVAYKESLNQPVVAEHVARELPEHLREYFMDRVRLSLTLPKASDPCYLDMAVQNEKNNGLPDCKRYQLLHLGRRRGISRPEF